MNTQGIKTPENLTKSKIQDFKPPLKGAVEIDVEKGKGIKTLLLLKILFDLPR